MVELLREFVRRESQLLTESKATRSFFKVVPDILKKVQKAVTEGHTQEALKHLRRLNDWIHDIVGSGKAFPQWMEADEEIMNTVFEFLESKNMITLISLMDLMQDIIQLDDLTLLPQLQDEFQQVQKVTQFLNQFNDAGSFFRAIGKGKQFPSLRQMQPMAEKGVTMIMSHGGFTLSRIDNREAACVLGKDTKWCVASLFGARHWRRYSEKGILYYITGPGTRLAVFVNQQLEGRTTVWDPEDEEIGVQGLIKALGDSAMPVYKAIKVDSATRSVSKGNQA